MGVLHVKLIGGETQHIRFKTLRSARLAAAQLNQSQHSHIVFAYANRVWW